MAHYYYILYLSMIKPLKSEINKPNFWFINMNLIFPAYIRGSVWFGIRLFGQLWNGQRLYVTAFLTSCCADDCQTDAQALLRSCSAVSMIQKKIFSNAKSIVQYLIVNNILFIYKDLSFKLVLHIFICIIASFRFLLKHFKKICCCLNRTKNVVSSLELQEKDTTNDVDYEGYLLHEYNKPALVNFTLSEYTEKGSIIWNLSSFIFIDLLNVVNENIPEIVTQCFS